MSSDTTSPPAKKSRQPAKSAEEKAAETAAKQIKAQLAADEKLRKAEEKLRNAEQKKRDAEEARKLKAQLAAEEKQRKAEQKKRDAEEAKKLKAQLAAEEKLRKAEQKKRDAEEARKLKAQLAAEEKLRKAEQKKRDAEEAKKQKALLAAEAKQRKAEQKKRDAEEEARRVAAAKENLAINLIRVLGSQRHASPESYPAILSKLLEYAEAPSLKPAELKQVLESPAFHGAAILCKPPAWAEGRSQAYYVLRSDLQPLLPNLAIAALGNAANQKPGGKNAVRTSLFKAADLAKLLVSSKDVAPLVAEGLEKLAEREDFPAELGWLEDKGQRRFFRRADIRPNGATSQRVASESAAHAAPQGSAAHAGAPSTPTPSKTTAPPQAPPADFAARFDAAYAELNNRSGALNQVKLLPMRQALSQFDRATFDAGLRQLRIANRYGLESAHGGSVKLTDEELQAGVQEGPQLLVYVSKK